MKGNELISIYILEILSQHAGEDRRMYQRDISRYLQEEYDIKVTRKTLGKYIASLREHGLVAGKRGIYKVNQFTDKELRIIIDSILYSQHIPAYSAKEIIKKLKDLSSKGLDKKMVNINYIESFNNNQNENLYNVLDNIDIAIEGNKKIKITVCHYNIDGELKDLWSDEISPYYIVASNSRYYIICYAGRKDKSGREMLESRRVDRISQAEILSDKKRVPLHEVTGNRSGFDLGKYMREHIYMFSGESDYITVKMQEKHIGYFIDWYGLSDEYGNKFRVKKSEESKGYVEITTKSNLNAAYYWALQYGELAEVIKPAALREKIRQGIKDILRKYGG